MPVFVNGVEITDEQVFREMQYHPAKNQEVAMQLAAEALAIRELLLQEAAALGLAERKPGEEPVADDERIGKLLAAVIKVPEIDEASCRRFYDHNLPKFTKEGVTASYDEARPAIASYLEGTSWQTAVRQYIQILVGKAKIAGLQLEGADSPLVQ